MFNILKRRSTHSARLARWMPPEHLEHVSRSMAKWYGPPIAMAGVPGAVYVGAGGDFVGEIKGGWFSNYLDHLDLRARRRARARERMATMGVGFSSLADMVAKKRNPDNYRNLYQTKGSVAVAGQTAWGDYWWSSTAGAVGGAAPGGTAHDKTNTGALTLLNAPSGTGQFYLGHDTKVQAANYGWCSSILYDRLFSVTKTMNSTGAEAVSGVPTRYQSVTPSDPDYAAGNFLFPSVSTVLPATAHNWATCTYTDQDGNAGATLPTWAGKASTATQTIDLNDAYYWYMPLAAGDTGVKALTQMQCSAAIATGAISFVIGHPIAFWFHTALGGTDQLNDGILSAMQLERIFDDACLSVLRGGNFSGVGAGGITMKLETLCG